MGYLAYRSLTEAKAETETVLKECHLLASPDGLLSLIYYTIPGLPGWGRGVG